MPDLAEGAEFAGHRIEGVAGRGGMGTVYRATHIALDHLVALKVIAPDLAGDESFRARFKSESRIAVSLRHPNVVPIHHAGEEDGLLFVTMDLIEGPDLRKLLIARGPLRPEVAVGILEQVASALDVAHSRGLVHRDIKPGNILIDSDSGGDHAYLTDFGLTKRIGQASDASALTSTGAFVGTLDYVAPEQIRGDDLDARTDVYALGCVLYEMVAASPPFADREEKVAKMYAHLQDSPAPLDGPAKPLEPVIARAMEKDRDGRFPSAGDLARAAAAALGGTGPLQAERSVATGPAAPTQVHETPADATAAPAKPRAPDARPTAAAPPPVGATDETVEATASAADETTESREPGAGVAEPESDPAQRDQATVGARTAAVGEPITRRSSAPQRTPEGGKGPRSPTALLAALLLIVAAAAIGIVVLGGGDNGGPERTTTTGGGGGGPVGSAGEPVDLAGFPVGVAARGGAVRAVTRKAPTLAEIKPGGADPVTLPGPAEGAEDVAFAEGAWWATATGIDSVVGVTEAGGPVGPIEVGDEPRGIAADGTDLWVTNALGNSITKLTVADGAAVVDRTVSLTEGSRPQGIAIDSERESLWVSSRDNDRLIRVGLADPEGDQEAIEIGDNPKGVAVVAGNVWVANADDGTVTRYDPENGASDEIEVRGTPRDLIEAEGRVWVTNEQGFVSAIGTDEAAEVLGRVELDGAPAEDVAFDRRAGTLWVTTGKDDTVIPVDPS
jgi:hypothetical protein